MEKLYKSTQNNNSESKIRKDVKKDFLKFLEENKKDLSTGFGAFHTDNHSNW